MLEITPELPAASDPSSLGSSKRMRRILGLLVNLGLSIIIGIVISATYFLILPIPEINFELGDCSQATLLTTGVAFFAGVAEIIASKAPIEGRKPFRLA